MKVKTTKDLHPVIKTASTEHGIKSLESLLKKNEALLMTKTNRHALKRIQEKAVNKLLLSKPQKITSATLLEKGADDLDLYPLRGWLSHSSDKDQKVHHLFWRLEDDVITLFLSESEALFYKHIPISSIRRVRVRKNGLQFLLVLHGERLYVSPTVKNRDSCKKVVKRWSESIKKSIGETEALDTKTTITDEAKLEKHGIFEGIQFALDLEGSSFNEKKQLRELITKNGGQISYIITGNTKFLITCQEQKSGQRSSLKHRKAVKLRIPLVTEKFVHDCIEQATLIEVDVLRLEAEEGFSKGKISLPNLQPPSHSRGKFDVESVEKFKIDDGECPDFPEDFFVPKYSILALTDDKVTKKACVEAQIGKYEDNLKVCRVMVTKKSDFETVSCIVYCVETVTDLTLCYEALVRQYMNEGMVRTTGIIPVDFMNIISEPLALMLSEMKSSSGVIHPEVVRLVESVWTDSIGELKNHLGDDPEKITPDQVRNAMIILLKIEEALKSKARTEDMSADFYKYIRPKDTSGETLIDTVQKVAKKREICQVLKDVVNANEITSVGNSPSSIFSRYVSLKCAVIWLPPQGREFKTVVDLLPGSSEKCNYRIHNIYKVSRTTENVELRRDLGNEKLLFHASAAANFVGIFSRGLLMPFTATSELGISRHDEGKLGSGIYFSDSFEMCSAFTTRSQTRGSRLMLVNEVMLGKVFETKEPKVDLVSPPEGYHSVKGIEVPEKGANEYAVYNTNQQRMKYIIEFTLNNSEAVTPHSTKPYSLPLAVTSNSIKEPPPENMDPKLQQVQCGLILEGSEASAKLEEFHVRAKIIDLVSEVTVLQSYKNLSEDTVEAKYVFPLANNAAVCGFEAFINEKHVVGTVKEKEEAHREYKKAIAEGHGAYLMDEEKPNVFTVSIGNVPPRARVVIKITYISELETINDPESCVLFVLPGNISQWQKDQILLSSSATQSTTMSATVLKGKKSSFMASIDMPFDIIDVKSPTHKIIAKRTASKACVKLQKTGTLGDEDFRLLIKVAEIHVPRIWIESDEADQDGGQVAMVTFFPEFDFENSATFDCTILLDTSNSMAGSAALYLKHIAVLLIDSLPEKSKFNVVTFGSKIAESFVGFENSALDSKAEGKRFVEEQTCSGGSDLIHILDSIDLLLEEKKTQAAHNIFLLSDGHLSEEERVLRLASRISERSNSQTRIFSFGIGSQINSHLLQSVSVLTGGNYEHFSPSTKNTWKAQMQRQIGFASQSALTDVYIDWCNYEGPEDPGDTIVNVPRKVKCVFAGSCLTAYSFLRGCTKATLSAKINGKEFSTTIIAHALSYIKGKTLHRLAAKAIFKEYETGRLAEDGYVDQLVRDQSKSSIIKLSIKHSVISKFTSFVAIEKREKSEDLSITSGPLVSDLVESAFTDIIPEVGWEFEEMTVEENIDLLLRRAVQLQTSSILQARELALEAKTLFDSLCEPDQIRLLQVYATLCRLNATPKDFDAQDILKQVFKPIGSALNYDVVNSISKSEDSLLAEAVEELANRSWPDYCSVQLASVPDKLRPLAVGLFLDIHDMCCQNRIPFIGDDKRVAFFWMQMRDIDAGDNTDISGSVIKQAIQIKGKMKRFLDRKHATRKSWKKKRIRTEREGQFLEAVHLPSRRNVISEGAGYISKCYDKSGKKTAAPLLDTIPSSKPLQQESDLSVDCYSLNSFGKTSKNQTSASQLDSKKASAHSFEMESALFSTPQQTSLFGGSPDFRASAFGTVLESRDSDITNSMAWTGGGNFDVFLPRSQVPDSHSKLHLMSAFRVPVHSGEGSPVACFSTPEAFSFRASVNVPAKGLWASPAAASVSVPARKPQSPSPLRASKLEDALLKWAPQDVSALLPPPGVSMPPRDQETMPTPPPTDVSAPVQGMQAPPPGASMRPRGMQAPPLPQGESTRTNRRHSGILRNSRSADSTRVEAATQLKSLSSNSSRMSLAQPIMRSRRSRRSFAIDPGVSVYSDGLPRSLPEKSIPTGHPSDRLSTKNRSQLFPSSAPIDMSHKSHYMTSSKKLDDELETKLDSLRSTVKQAPEASRRLVGAEYWIGEEDGEHMFASESEDVYENICELASLRLPQQSSCLPPPPDYFQEERKLAKYAGRLRSVVDSLPSEAEELADDADDLLLEMSADSSCVDSTAEELSLERSAMSPSSSSLGSRDSKLHFQALGRLMMSSDGQGNFHDMIHDDEFFLFPEDDKIAREEYGHGITEVLKICKSIVIAAGGRSLGPNCLKMALNMLLTAIMIQIMKDENDEDIEELIAKSEKWLKQQDARHPMLYRRLELGCSWDAAAINVAKKILEQL